MYAIAREFEDGRIEYLREEYGADCYTDDLGNALTWESPEKCPASPEEYILELKIDEDGCIYEAVPWEDR